ncbi:MAG: DUF302 domain-containing protein [Cyclobacteriaceae bacterium]
MTIIRYILAFTLTLATLTVFSQETTIYNSPMSYEETSEKLKGILEYKGFVNDAFKTVEYDQDTSELNIRVSTFEFSDPYIMGGIVACEPTAAIDMPFRIAVWSEEEDVYIGFVDPIWLKRRYMIRDCDAILSEYSQVLVRIVNETIRVK